MIDETRKKLREAEFFYKYLIDENKKFTRNEPDAFHFYLSGFMSAARSVTFVLQAEEKEKYDEWFPDWYSSLDDPERQVLDFAKDQRNYLLKEGVSHTTTTWQYVPLNDYRAFESGDAMRIKWFGPPGTPPPKLGRLVHLYDLGDNEEEVTSVCERYLNLLRRLVKDFLSKFSKKESA